MGGRKRKTPLPSAATPNALPVRPGKQKDTTNVCPHCSRPGHKSNDCPYHDSSYKDNYMCSNCDKQGHKCSDCPFGCRVKNCEHADQHKTWEHPDESSDLSPMVRTSIHGYGPAPKAPGAPNTVNVKAIHGEAADMRGTVTRPAPKYPIHQGNSDDTFAPQDRSAPSVVTNYIRVNCGLEKVYVYTIIVNPQPSKCKDGPDRVIPISKLSELKRIYKAVAQIAPLRGRQDHATDYKTLWAGSPLGTNACDSVTLWDLQYQKQSGRLVTLVSVELKYHSILDMSGGQAALAGAVTPTRNPNESKRALNAMVTRCITSATSEELFESGQNTFYIKGTEKDVGCINIQRGYYVSVRPGSLSILLNVNITHGAFLKPMKLPDFLREYHNLGLHREYGSAKGLLKGRSVRVMYDRPGADGVDRNANRVKVIAGFGQVPHVQQFESNGRMCTVKQWYEEQGICTDQFQIRDDLECVNVGLPVAEGAEGSQTIGGRASWIPCDLLELEPDQAFGRKLGQMHMKSMMKIALQSPATNHIAIEQEGLSFLGLRNLNNPLKLHLQLSAQPSLIRIPATRLASPTIQYGNRPISNINNASWNLQNVRFKAPKMILKPPLCVLDLRDRPNSGPVIPVVEIARTWLTQCESHGLLAPGINPKETKPDQLVIAEKVIHPPVNGIHFYREFAKRLATATESMKLRLGGTRSLQLVVVLLQSTDASVYGALKRIADTTLGFHTVCGTVQKLTKLHDKALFSNLLLKQNLKEGGTNHAVLLGNKSAFADLGQDTLVIGVDVVHPNSPNPAIAAMVGSTASDMITFPGHVRLQPARKEILTSQNMTEMATACVNMWAKHHQGAKPRRIVYYRDGVGEDDYQNVLDEEVAQLQQTVPAASITVIVVGKRHHTRFFAPNDRMTYPEGRNGKLNGNVTPGVLVDTVITQPDSCGYQDFFLQSHAALAGTAKSAHYVVLRNDPGNKLSMKQIEQITFAFCYNYARATKGVSYCAPAYYADRLCDRAHVYLRSFVSSKFLNNWHKNEVEEGMNKQEGEDAFRLRVRDAIANDVDWVPANRTSGNPWVPAFDECMFWL